MLTKLRIGCTKLKSRRFLTKNETDACPLWDSKSKDTPENPFFLCQNKDLTVLRNMHIDIINHEYPNFKYFNLEIKLYCNL